MSSGSCETCEFWCNGDYVSFEMSPSGIPMGECRVRPPVLAPFPLRVAQTRGEEMTPGSDEAADQVIARNHTAWPVTLQMDWCRKWEEASRIATGRRRASLLAEDVEIVGPLCQAIVRGLETPPPEKLVWDHPVRRFGSKLTHHGERISERPGSLGGEEGLRGVFDAASVTYGESVKQATDMFWKGLPGWPAKDPESADDDSPF